MKFFNLREALGDKKLYCMTLDIYACDVEVSFDISDIIPEQFKAEKED